MILNKENIITVLNSVVNPLLATHGGGVELQSLKRDRKIHLVLRGACSTCPAHNDTIQGLVQERFEKAFGKGGFELVVAQGVSESLIAEAKKRLALSESQPSTRT